MTDYRNQLFCQWPRGEWCVYKSVCFDATAKIQYWNDHERLHRYTHYSSSYRWLSETATHWEINSNCCNNSFSSLKVVYISDISLFKGRQDFILCPYCSFYHYLWSQGGVFCMDLFDNSKSVDKPNPHQRVVADRKSISDHSVCFSLCCFWAPLTPGCYSLNDKAQNLAWVPKDVLWCTCSALATIYLLWCEWEKDYWENIMLLFTGTDTWQGKHRGKTKSEILPSVLEKWLEGATQWPQNAETKEK